MKNVLKPLAAAMLGGVLLTGCIGQFALTKQVYKWNVSQGNKWVAEGIFLVFNILPVYGITLLVDGIALNAVEFWTGSNPLNGQKAIAKAGDQKRVLGTDGSSATLTLLEDQRIRVDYKTAEGKSGSLMLEQGEDSIALTTLQGRLLAKANADGTVTDGTSLTQLAAVDL